MSTTGFFGLTILTPAKSQSEDGGQRALKFQAPYIFHLKYSALNNWLIGQKHWLSSFTLNTCFIQININQLCVHANYSADNKYRALNQISFTLQQVKPNFFATALKIQQTICGWFYFDKVGGKQICADEKWGLLQVYVPCSIIV